MVTIHSPGCLALASSAMRSWMSRIERTGPSAGNTLRKASRSIWAWPSVMPGMTALPLRSTTRVAGPAMAAIAASGPTARIRSPAIAIACAIVNAGSTVMILPLVRMRSAGVVPTRAGICNGACAAPVSGRAADSTPAAPAAPAAFKSRRRVFSTACLASGEIGDRVRRLVVLLAEIRPDLFAVSGWQAGIADHLPRRHMAVAAVDRVGEESLHADLQERVEEHRAGKARELRLPLFHCLQRSLALRRGKPVEILAVGLARPGVGGCDTGAEEFSRRQRKLIAEFRFALWKGPVAIEPRAGAVGACELAIDERRDPAFAPRGRKFVGGNDRIRGGDEESVLGRGEREQRFGLGRGRSTRRCLWGLCRHRRRRRKPGGDGGSRCSEEEMTTRYRPLIRWRLGSAPVCS